MATIDELIRTKRTLICVGPGGVGKTTTSAALALRAAMLGRRTLVMTVDPAHRLANSLGLDAFEHEEQEIDEAAFEAAGLERNAGLFAMMLDTRRTFDAVVERYAANPATRRRILESPFYEQASTRLAGSQEYMAMEKLFELHGEGRYDLLVLDTPPTVHALDFLDAPDRLESFLSQSTDGLVVRSTRTLSRLGLSFLRLNSVILKGVSRFLGLELFTDIVNFLRDFESMYTGFRSRATAVKELVRSDEVAFVVLTGPSRPSIDEGLFFQARLKTDGMRPGTFVVNRVRTDFGPLTDELRQSFRARFTAPSPQTLTPAADSISKNATDYQVLADRDRRELTRLREELPESTTLRLVPDFDEDIHDLASLNRFAERLTS